MLHERTCAKFASSVQPDQRFEHVVSLMTATVNDERPDSDGVDFDYRSQPYEPPCLQLNVQSCGWLATSAIFIVIASTRRLPR